jgi:hypothetical protein
MSTATDDGEYYDGNRRRRNNSKRRDRDGRDRDDTRIVLWS